MLRIVTRVVGAVLALVGLALAAVGVWFATQLGGSGTATFTASPGSTGPVVLTPDVLNRVDADITLTVTPSSGGRAWIALANPSDATAVLGDSARTEVTGVSVGDWALLTAERGTGDPVDLASAPLWRNQKDAAGPVSMTVQQAQAPESVVITAQEGTVERVTLRVSDKTWFVEAVVAALVGVLLLVVGLVVAWPRRRRSAVAAGGSPPPGTSEAAATGGEQEPVEPSGTARTTEATDPDRPTTKEATP
jgi:hypothetical protein